MVVLVSTASVEASARRPGAQQHQSALDQQRRRLVQPQQHQRDHHNRAPAPTSHRRRLQQEGCRQMTHGVASLPAPARGARSQLARRPSIVRASSGLLLLLGAASLALAYPSGAPEQACKDLKPGHGVEPQTGAAPFELAQDRLQVGAGEQIKVTLSSPSGTNFKGLIVQAHNEAGEPRGKFLPGTGLKALDSCSAVTHADKEAKKTATLVWQAPEDLKAKEAFVFKATVVKKFNEIYTNLRSSLKAAAAA